jgi:hypothetical protein
MKVFAIGIARNEGVSKKKDPKGKPYDMCSLMVLQPLEPGSGTSADGGTWKRSGYGFQVADFQASPECVEQFKDVKFPCNLEVQTETAQMFGRMTTVVVGCSVEKLKAA